MAQTWCSTSRDTSERLTIGRDLESHVLNVAANPAALAEMFDRTSPAVVVNCIGLTVGRPEELRAANVDVVNTLIDVVEGRHRVQLVQLGSAAEYGALHHRSSGIGGCPLRTDQCLRGEQVGGHFND